MKFLILVVITLNLAACASYFKRKQCESINWFEHGKGVALRGEWLASDSLVNECRKAEADIQEAQLDQGFKNGMQRYCSPENSYKVGKEGDLFSRDLCDGPELNNLLANHRRGVTDYCAKSNGHNAGASGKKYQNICPKELEPAFLAEYRKGRKKYVETLISTRKSEVQDIDNSLSNKRREVGFTQIQLSRLENQKSALETQKQFIPATNSAQLSFLEKQLTTLNSDISSERGQLNSQQNQIRSLEQTRDAKMAEITNLQSELPGLE